MKKNISIIIVSGILILILIVLKKRRTENMDVSDTICYDQTAVTGLGDRLLDICAVMTKQPESNIHIKWNTGKDQERSVYDTSLIQIDNGEISEIFVSCSQNIEINPDRPGANAPSIDKIDTFRNMAKRIKPAPEVEEVIPSKELSYVCIHIRVTDKLNDVNPNDPIGVSTEQYKNIKSKCVDYVKTHIDKTYLICTDDEKLKNGFIQECGSEMKLIEIKDYKNLDRAIVDLFAMSRAELIIQCTKYSTFSITASLIGGIPLINYFESEVMGADWNWKPVLYGTVG
jgi:hypothetical protein